MIDEFGGPDHEYPLVERKATVLVEYDGENRLIGFIGVERTRDLRVYTSRRDQNHFYEVGGGYAISDEALYRAESVDVTHVLIHEKYSGHVYEYALRQYLDEGEPVPPQFVEDPDDDQTYVEKDAYQFRYPSHADELFVRSFDDAIEHIRRRLTG
jgi:hypothetical protein